MNEEVMDRVHRYLLSEMDEAERSAFESELAADAKLAATVQSERLVLALIYHDGRRQMKSRIFGTAAQTARPKVGRSRLRWMWIPALAAAAVALLIWWNWNPSAGQLADEVFGHFDTPELEKLMRGSEAKSPLADAVMAYKRGEYQEAEAMLDGLPKGDAVLDSKAALLRGECAYRRGDFDRAHECYYAAITLASEENAMVRVARLHDALTMIRLGKNDAAKSLLRDLMEQQHDDLSAETRQDIEALLQRLGGS